LSAPEAAPPVEEKKPKAVRKPKKPKVSPSVYKFYTVSGAVLSKTKRECPRCGRGTFMAQHKDRYYCGKCGFTEWFERKR
jgi:small subunit ribosomal protein S27Ae